MNVSFVIPTLNRTQAIIDLVNDVLKQEYRQLEVVVVDQTSGPNLALATLARADSRLCLLHSDVVGTCHARNMGLAAATGDIIIFTDDDCRLSSQDFVASHVKNYSDPKVGGVGGRVLDVNQSLKAKQSGPVCTVTKTGRIYPNASSHQRQDINAPRGGNMSFRKSVIIQVGGFDEHFRGNAMREETDFSLRVVKAGWRIVYEPTAELTHLALAGGSRSTDRLTWYRDFFFNESYFFLKHFSRGYLPLLLLRKARAMTACWLYYGHGSLVWFIAPWKSFTEARKLVRLHP